ncbi:hypothetical protein MSG28_001281 [Choristoneura fumiferana]|uniref:Uncharacterized protein n=1 Tax=Choristoneura fumiferana TaxID=7141 RepID=A0ACC0K4F2_CHOFU|nr:hypothetical protein MSG28_001281 [Choristoneura fumiferana]
MASDTATWVLYMYRHLIIRSISGEGVGACFRLDGALDTTRLTREEDMEQKLAEMQVHLQFLDSLYRARQAEVMNLQASPLERHNERQLATCFYQFPATLLMFDPPSGRPANALSSSSWSPLEHFSPPTVIYETNLKSGQQHSGANRKGYGPTAHIDAGSSDASQEPNW